MTKSSLFDHFCAFFCCQPAQAAGADGGAGKAVGPWITLKIRLGRGEASRAPAAPGQIEVAQSSRHFNLRRCSAGCNEITTSPPPYLIQMWLCGLFVCVYACLWILCMYTCSTEVCTASSVCWRIIIGWAVNSHFVCQTDDSAELLIVFSACSWWKLLGLCNDILQSRPTLCDKCLEITSVKIWCYIN